MAVLTHLDDAWIAAATRLRAHFKASGFGTEADPFCLSSGFASSVSITRTNDTNAYTAGDVIGAATGSTAAVTFANIGPASGGEILITSSALEIDVAAIPSGMTSFRLYLYSSTPASALGDNAAWDLPSGDRSAYLGYIDLGTPVDLGSTLYVQSDGINRQVTVPSGGALYGYLVTIGAHTPGAQAVHKVTLHSKAV